MSTNTTNYDNSNVNDNFPKTSLISETDTDSSLAVTAAVVTTITFNRRSFNSRGYYYYSDFDNDYDRAFRPAFADARKRKMEANGVPFAKFDKIDPSDISLWKVAVDAANAVYRVGGPSAIPEAIATAVAAYAAYPVSDLSAIPEAIAEAIAALTAVTATTATTSAKREAAELETAKREAAEREAAKREAYERENAENSDSEDEYPPLVEF